MGGRFSGEARGQVRGSAELREHECDPPAARYCRAPTAPLRPSTSRRSILDAGSVGGDVYSPVDRRSDYQLGIGSSGPCGLLREPDMLDIEFASIAEHKSAVVQDPNAWHLYTVRPSGLGRRLPDQRQIGVLWSAGLLNDDHDLTVRIAEVANHEIRHRVWAPRPEVLKTRP